MLATSIILYTKYARVIYYSIALSVLGTTISLLVK